MEKYKVRMKTKNIFSKITLGNKHLNSKYNGAMKRMKLFSNDIGNFIKIMAKFTKKKNSFSINDYEYIKSKLNEKKLLDKKGNSTILSISKEKNKGNFSTINRSYKKRYIHTYLNLLRKKENESLNNISNKNLFFDKIKNVSNKKFNNKVYSSIDLNRNSLTIDKKLKRKSFMIPKLSLNQKGINKTICSKNKNFTCSKDSNSRNLIKKLYNKIKFGYLDQFLENSEKERISYQKELSSQTHMKRTTSEIFNQLENEEGSDKPKNLKMDFFSKIIDKKQIFQEASQLRDEKTVEIKINKTFNSVSYIRQKTSNLLKISDIIAGTKDENFRMIKKILLSLYPNIVKQFINNQYEGKKEYNREKFWNNYNKIKKLVDYITTKYSS